MTNNILVEQCMNYYNVKAVKGLALSTGIPYSTLNKWNNEGPSQIGELLLSALIKNKQLTECLSDIIYTEEKKTAALDKARFLI